MDNFVGRNAFSSKDSFIVRPNPKLPLKLGVQFSKNGYLTLFSKLFHHLWKNGLRWGIGVNNPASVASLIWLEQLCRILKYGQERRLVKN
jgi:hypothetical protein